MEKITRTHTVTENGSHEESRSAFAFSIVDQIVFLALGIVEVLLLIRFIFKLTGANVATGIVSFVYAVTDVLMAPFRFIFPVETVQGAVFEWSVIVAMIFYALLAWIVMKLIAILYSSDKAIG